MEMHSNSEINITMNDRIISFEKISNARDLGGLRTAQGSIISSGLLIRSANLSDATETDKKILREKYRLSKIIDLRTEIEQNEMPDSSMENVDCMSIPIFDESVAGISHEKGSSKEQLLAAGRTEGEAKTIRDIFLAKEEYLEAAFSAIDTQYGNDDVFLYDGLNIPQKLIERFQSSVL